jgi:hypothetical protein
MSLGPAVPLAGSGTEVSMSCLPALIDSLDESLATIRRLAELGPLLDGQVEFHEHVIEILALVAQHAAHAERLSTQLAQVVLPTPRPVDANGDWRWP